jgi:MYXO-CTERM domain-containing protein
MSLVGRLAFGTCAVASATAIFGGAAHAMVKQPSGETMPVPTASGEVSIWTSRGYPADAGTLAGLFKYHEINGVAGGDMSMDPVRDAQITPGTFSPQCGLTGTIVLHGGGCQNELGWYNATENPATKPADNQIYTLVPANIRKPAAPATCGPQDVCCPEDFCPLATRMTTQPLSQHDWANPLPDFAGNIRTNPNYKGGLIGFALKGVAGSQCTQTKYSQAELNDKNAAGMPWITTLIYQSVADPQAYYIAFEDLPTCAMSWKGCNQQNDGDFNDFVFYLHGLSCNGGGQPCTIDTAKGICRNGATQCAAGGTATTCVPVVQPSAEKCDGVDNDCNDMIDEGDNLCPVGEVCAQGVCRHACDDTEFPCAVGLTCDTSDGLCKDRGCVGKTCPAGQVCQLGVCAGGCDGVTCPHGQTCLLGHCASLCDGITCPADKPACEGGACQPLCSDKCRSCDTGFTCDMRAGSATLGHCLETGCENKTCPAGQVCVAGACKDGCDGVKCPGGQECMMGSCTPVAPPDAGTPAGSGGGGGFVILGTGGQGGTVGTGGIVTVGTAGHPGTGGGAGTTPQRGSIQTCNCEVARGPGAGGVALLLLGLAIAAGRRRK